MRKLLLFIPVVLMISSCVTNRKFVLLQKNDVNGRDLPKDSAVREYRTQAFDYRVQPNDALYIRFESLTPEEFDFFREAAPNNAAGNRNFAVTSELVDPAGTILFPVIGKVRVAGLTVFEIQDSLQQIASRYLESAVVKVRLVNFRFTVLGEVAQEGTVTTFNNRVTIPEALGLAGGLGELADRRNVKVIRHRGDTTSVGYVDLLSEDLITSPYYYINQSDVLVVPALRQRPFRKYFGPNFTLLVSTLSLVFLIVNLSK
jgi:polysaccharide biosynthesis/export protein